MPESTYNYLFLIGDVVEHEYHDKQVLYWLQDAYRKLGIPETSVITTRTHNFRDKIHILIVTENLSYKQAYDLLIEQGKG